MEYLGQIDERTGRELQDQLTADGVEFTVEDCHVGVMLSADVVHHGTYRLPVAKALAKRLESVAGMSTFGIGRSDGMADLFVWPSLEAIADRLSGAAAPAKPLTFEARVRAATRKAESAAEARIRAAMRRLQLKGWAVEQCRQVIIEGISPVQIGDLCCRRLHGDGEEERLLVRCCEPHELRHVATEMRGQEWREWRQGIDIKAEAWAIDARGRVVQRQEIRS